MKPGNDVERLGAFYTARGKPSLQRHGTRFNVGLKPQSPTARLDRISSKIASFDDTIPTDIKHVATVLGNLAVQVRAIGETGKLRDDQIAGLARDVAIVKRDVEKIEVKINELVANQFSKDERETMKVIITGHEFRDRLFRGGFKWLKYIAATITATSVITLAFKDQIKAVAAWVARALS